MRRVALALVFVGGCARPAPIADPPRAAARAPRVAARALHVTSGPKAPWREPAMLTTPRHPLADPRVVFVRDGKARIRTVNAVVTALATGGVESVEAVAPDAPEQALPSDCAETRSFRASWARLVEPAQLVTLRAPLPAPSGAACSPPSAPMRVRTAAAGASTSPCEHAECVRGTTDPEPELTRTQLSLSPGRCAPADADDTGACRAGARRTHEPDAILADLEARSIRFLSVPPGCAAARARRRRPADARV